MIPKDTFFSKKQTINFGGKLVDLQSPVVMGIINITPDSFYENSRCNDEKTILTRCAAIISEGAQIIDIGAYSSRPGAGHISEKEELERLIPALRSIRKEFPDAVLSVDTFRSQVARIVIEEFGVRLINDISAGALDENMPGTVASLKAAYIAMHMRGTPVSMQEQTEYNDLMLDLMTYFAGKIHTLKQTGVHDIILDPGFGFGKTLEQNYHLLAHLDEFRIFELPVMVGLSRKSMVYKLLETIPEKALTGTISLNTIALLNGADILRVHDVKEAMESIKIVSAYKNVYL